MSVDDAFTPQFLGVLAMYFQKDLGENPHA
jgi:hypothetical protein